MANRRSFSNNDFSDCDTTGYDLLPLMSEGGNWKGIEAREKPGSSSQTEMAIGALSWRPFLWQVDCILTGLRSDCRGDEV